MFGLFDRRRAVRFRGQGDVEQAVQYSRTAISKANRLIDELAALEVVITRKPNGPEHLHSR